MSGVADESLELDTLLPEDLPLLMRYRDWCGFKSRHRYAMWCSPFRPKQTSGTKVLMAVGLHSCDSATTTYFQADSEHPAAHG